MTVTQFRARERRSSVNAKDEKKIHIWHGYMYRPHYELKYFLKEHFYFHIRFHKIFMTKFAIKAFETDPLFLQLSKHKFGHQFFINFFLCYKLRTWTYWELAKLKNSILNRPFLIFFVQFFFPSSQWTLVTNYVLEWMGINFYYYDGLQPKMRTGIINEHEGIATSLGPWKKLFFFKN